MIWFFKYLASKVISYALLPIYLFSVKTNRVLFISYGGLQYSCNPKYITEFLLEKYADKYEIIWVFKEPEKFDYLDDKILKVKYLSLRHLYYVITSSVCITNMGFNKFFYVRKNQHFVQTWHGGGAYKRSGDSLSKNYFQRHLDHQHDNLITDFISSSQYFSDYFIQDLNYRNNILSIGMPRNSFLLKEKNNKELQVTITKAVDEKYHHDKYYVLYAPTWRDDGTSYELPDFSKIILILRERTQKDVVILFRSHHFHTITDSEISDYCINVTNYPDMQELLLISNILISDYSSCIWDYSLLYRPCFLYVPDLDKYENMRGFYTDINNWGFTVCKDKQSLDSSINLHDPKLCEDKIKMMHSKFGSFENEESADKLINILNLT